MLYFHWQFINTTTYWLVINWEIQASLKEQPEAVQASYYLGHSIPGFLIMIDMWGFNSVTFIYSHCFLIVGFECLFIILTMLVSSEGEVFSSTSQPSILVALTLIIFAVTTHTMLYNMNVFVKIDVLRER